jgi:hypothetical protein
MERETEIEPATSSLGSCSLPLGQRRINGLQRAEWGRVRHCGRQLNTILNTKRSRLILPTPARIFCREGEARAPLSGSGRACSTLLTFPRPRQEFTLQVSEALNSYLSKLDVNWKGVDHQAAR